MSTTTASSRSSTFLGRSLNAVWSTTSSRAVVAHIGVGAHFFVARTTSTPSTPRPLVATTTVTAPLPTSTSTTLALAPVLVGPLDPSQATTTTSVLLGGPQHYRALDYASFLGDAFGGEGGCREDVCVLTAYWIVGLGALLFLAATIAASSRSRVDGARDRLAARRAGGSADAAPFVGRQDSDPAAKQSNSKLEQEEQVYRASTFLGFMGPYLVAPATCTVEQSLTALMRLFVGDLVAPPRFPNDLRLSYAFLASNLLPTGMHVHRPRNGDLPCSGQLYRRKEPRTNIWDKHEEEAEGGSPGTPKKQSWMVPLSPSRMLVWIPEERRLLHLRARRSLADRALTVAPNVVVFVVGITADTPWLPMSAMILGLALPALLFLAQVCVLELARSERVVVAVGMLFRIVGCHLFQVIRRALDLTILVVALVSSTGDARVAIMAVLGCLVTVFEFAAELWASLSCLEVPPPLRFSDNKHVQGVLGFQKAFLSLCLALSAVLVVPYILDRSISGTLVSLILLVLLAELFVRARWEVPSDGHAKRLGHTLKKADWKRLEAELRSSGHVRPNGAFLEHVFARRESFWELQPYLADLSMLDMLRVLDSPSRFVVLKEDSEGVAGVTCAGLEAFGRLRDGGFKTFKEGKMVVDLTFQEHGDGRSLEGVASADFRPTALLIRDHLERAKDPGYVPQVPKQKFENAWNHLQRFSISEVPEGDDAALPDQDDGNSEANEKEGKKLIIRTGPPPKGRQASSRHKTQVVIGPRAGQKALELPRGAVQRLENALSLVLDDALRAENLGTGKPKLFLVGKLSDFYPVHIAAVRVAFTLPDGSGEPGANGKLQDEQTPSTAGSDTGKAVVGPIPEVVGAKSGAGTLVPMALSHAVAAKKGRLPSVCRFDSDSTDESIVSSDNEDGPRMPRPPVTPAKTLPGVQTCQSFQVHPMVLGEGGVPLGGPCPGRLSRGSSLQEPPSTPPPLGDAR